MSNPKTPAAKADDNTEIIAARRQAAAKLLPLFGGTAADGKTVDGVFHQHGIAAVCADNASYVSALRADEHARTLAIVASARGNRNFPPQLVAEFLSREGDEPDRTRWFGEVFLSGLAEVFKVTGVGIMLPPSSPSLDLVRSANNVFQHLKDEEGKALGLTSASEAPRRVLSTDLMAMVEEAGAAPVANKLTAAQNAYRWAINAWEKRENQKSNKAAAGRKIDNDAAGLLPKTSKPLVNEPEPAPAPPAPAITSPGLVAADATVAPAPAPPKRKAKPQQVATPAEPAPAADDQLVIEALKASGPAGSAMALLVHKGSKTLAEAVAFAKVKGLF